MRGIPKKFLNRFFVKLGRKIFKGSKKRRKIDVRLEDLDKKFYHSMTGHEEIEIVDYGIYHTIIVNGEKAGMVGYIPSQTSKEVGFVQIVIKPEFRGTGLVEISECLLAEKHGLKIVFATIDVNNTASQRAHKKVGYKMVPKVAINYLRKMGVLEKDETRMVKEY